MLKMDKIKVLLFLLFGCAAGLQCDVPGECYIMSIGGSRKFFFGDPERTADVELTSLDPDKFPVPECLENLNPFPVEIYAHAGALDYSREFCKVCLILLIVMLLLLLRHL